MVNDGTVIDATEMFARRGKIAPKLMTGDEVATLIFNRATQRSLDHGVTVDLVVAALIKQIAKIAEANGWSDERKRDMLPPAWIRLIEEKDDSEPY